MPEAQEEREPVNVPFASLINKSGNTVTLHTERPFRMLSTASDGPGFRGAAGFPAQRPLV